MTANELYNLFPSVQLKHDCPECMGEGIGGSGPDYCFTCNGHGEVFRWYSIHDFKKLLKIQEEIEEESW